MAVSSECKGVQGIKGEARAVAHWVHRGLPMKDTGQQTQMGLLLDLPHTRMRSRLMVRSGGLDPGSCAH